MRHVAPWIQHAVCAPAAGGAAVGVPFADLGLVCGLLTATPPLIKPHMHLTGGVARGSRPSVMEAARIPVQAVSVRRGVRPLGEAGERSVCSGSAVLRR